LAELPVKLLPWTLRYRPPPGPDMTWRRRWLRCNS
jgi:hypothetical protein